MFILDKIILYRKIGISRQKLKCFLKGELFYVTTILCGIAVDNLNKNYKFEIFNSHMMIKMSEEVASIGITG